MKIQDRSRSRANIMAGPAEEKEGANPHKTITMHLVFGEKRPSDHSRYRAGLLLKKIAVR